MEFPFSKGTRPKKSRKGAVPINIETLMNKKRHEKGKISSLQFRAFSRAWQEKSAAGDYNPLYRPPLAGTMSAAGIRRGPSTSEEGQSYEEVHKKDKKAGDISKEEAISAAKTVSEKRKSLGQRAAEVAAISGTATPLVMAARRATKGFVDTRGGLGARLRGAGKGAASATLGDVTSQVVGGGLTGAVMTGAQGGLQISKAKAKVKSYLAPPGRQRGERKIKKLMGGGKIAQMMGMGGSAGSLGGLSSATGPSTSAFDAPHMTQTGRGSGDFSPSKPKKLKTTKQQAINPRLRVVDAMNRGVG